MKQLIISLLAFSAIVSTSFAQDYSKEDEEAIALAIEYSDNGNANKALDIYSQLLKKYPKSSHLLYETAYCYAVKQDFKKALKYLERSEAGTGLDGIEYALHGNCLDNLGKRKQAIEKYKEGISKHPTFGQLYLELGTTYAMENMLNEAVETYTAGIKVDPGYTSNYYRISQLLCQSNEPVWGIIYGEIHELLSPNSRRSEELSAAIFEAYNHNMKFQSDTTFLLTLTTKKAHAKEDGSYEIPFELLFEYYSVAPEVTLTVKEKGSVDIKSLTESRRNLITKMFENGQNQNYLYPIFKYQLRILEAGHWEAYNMWLLRKGNEEEYSAWMEDNSDKFSAFANWYKENNFDPVDNGKQ